MVAGDVIGQLSARCRQKPGRIGFPESDDVRILRVATQLLAEASVAGVTLFSARGATESLAQQHGVDLSLYADRLTWAAGNRDVDRLERLALAATAVAAGQLDAALAGNVATTADVIRAALRGIGLAAGVRTLSGAFIMNRPEGPWGEPQCFLYADCGVCIAPTLAQLVDIASESVRTWRSLFPGVPPAVAFLSFSTKGSAAHDSVSKVQEAASLFRARHPDVDGDGELQFDAAYDAAIGGRKAPGSPVAGRANIFIFPDLAAGNIAYKITQRLGGFEAYGPILQGLAKPFSDLSRGATVEDIRASAYVNLIRGVEF